MALPDFFIAGVPKAGTTALHRALAAHPDLFLSAVKEPKYFLTGDRRPAPSTQRGPGDAHSAQEWIWQQDRYEALFAAAPSTSLRGESTPFYLYDATALERIVAAVPAPRFVVVIRDPVDRAYSNWMHLWSDGLETLSFPDACDAEDARIAAGYAPFWHYRRVGRYGEQLRRLLSLVPADQVLVLRYRDLVDDSDVTLDRVCGFLGVRQGVVHRTGSDNVRPYVPATAWTNALGTTLRAGAAVGSRLPPQLWRQVSRPLLRLRYAAGAGAPRPQLAPQTRRELVTYYADDIAELQQLTGMDVTDWLGDSGSGEFRERRRTG
ncbi:MAG: sulfotransferase [Actinomycetota bacterium]|nr:MAG: sulfotransferase [Actinomycetota bacterium]